MTSSGIDLGKLPTLATPDTVDQHAGTIRTKGAAVKTKASEISTTWSQLTTSYKAPEEYAVHAALNPTSGQAQDLSSDAGTVASALTTYASTERGLVTRMATVRSEVASFESSIAGDDEWNKDEDKVKKRDKLVSDIDGIVADHQQAEQDCANIINALVGGPHYVTVSADGSPPPPGSEYYAMTKEMLDAAVREGQVPWAANVEWDKPWYRAAIDGVVEFGKGVWEGLKGTVTGLIGMINPFDWDTFSSTWKGIGTIAVDVATVTMPVVGMIRGKDAVAESGKRLVAVGKAMINLEEWKKNPAKAAGMLTADVLTVVATGGAGGVAKGMGTAAKAGRAVSALGKAADASKFGNALMKAGDFANRFGSLGKIKFGSLDMKIASVTERVGWVAEKPLLKALESKAGQAVLARTYPQVSKAMGTIDRYTTAMKSSVSSVTHGAYDKLMTKATNLNTSILERQAASGRPAVAGAEHLTGSAPTSVHVGHPGSGAPKPRLATVTDHPLAMKSPSASVSDEKWAQVVTDYNRPSSNPAQDLADQAARDRKVRLATSTGRTDAPVMPRSAQPAPGTSSYTHSQGVHASTSSGSRTALLDQPTSASHSGGTTSTRSGNFASDSAPCSGSGGSSGNTAVLDRPGDGGGRHGGGPLSDGPEPAPRASDSSPEHPSGKPGSTESTDAGTPSGDKPGDGGRQVPSEHGISPGATERKLHFYPPRRIENLPTLEDYINASKKDINIDEIRANYESIHARDLRIKHDFEMKVEQLQQRVGENILFDRSENMPSRKITRQDLIDNYREMKRMRVPTGVDQASWDSALERIRRAGDTEPMTKLLHDARMDMDHIQDLQFNGTDHFKNMQWLHRSANRSVGSQGRLHAVFWEARDKAAGITHSPDENIMHLTKPITQVTHGGRATTRAEWHAGKNRK